MITPPRPATVVVTGIVTQTKQRGPLWLFLILGLTAISVSAAYFCYSRGYTLYYGDSEAHLNIARRLLDSRTPGPEQLGTVWLPLPHLLMAPFAMNNRLWRSGLAGVIPSCVCFIIAGAFLFAAARRTYALSAKVVPENATVTGLAALLVFASNPNMLYLQSVPMTESIFMAALMVLLWATIFFRDTQSLTAVLAAAAASNAASLTRYEGWFLIPFVTVYFWITARRNTPGNISRSLSAPLLFAGLAALAPLAWLAHNQFYYSNALEFFNGDYSAIAIYKRQLANGAPYPGDHDWWTALKYYFAATRHVLGWPILILGAAATSISFFRNKAERFVWPFLLLLLCPIFYIWSMHSSGTPIYVPDLWPNTYYNTRYAILTLPLAAFAAAALVSRFSGRQQWYAVITLGALGIFNTTSICWKESQVNSEARRIWSSHSAMFLAANYVPGSGIFFSFGDLTGILREAGIPLREGLQDGNHPAWDAAVMRPELFLHEEWALAVTGDQVDAAIHRAQEHGIPYELRWQVIVKGAPAILIYKRPEMDQFQQEAPKSGNPRSDFKPSIQ